MEKRLVEFKRKGIDANSLVLLDPYDISRIEPINKKSCCVFFKNGNDINLAHSYDDVSHRLDVCSKIVIIKLSINIDDSKAL